MQGLDGRDLVTAVGDLNEDGRNDLVARNTATGRLQAYLGKGNGAFERKSIAGEWADYNKLAASGDLDGDGHVDLLARDRDGVLWRFPGNGDPDLRHAREAGRQLERLRHDRRVRRLQPGRPGRPRGPAQRRRRLRAARRRATATSATSSARSGASPAVGAITGGGDILGDGMPDVVARKGDDLIAIPHNGNIDTARPIATGLNLTSVNSVLNAGDWDRDGFGDIITRKASSGLLQLRRGNGKGGFEKPVKIASDFSKVKLLAAVGDMTGDGWPDLMGQPSGGSMRIYPGKGVNGLQVELRRAQRDQRRPPGAGRALGRRRRPGQPVPQRRRSSRCTAATARAGSAGARASAATSRRTTGSSASATSPSAGTRT